MTGYSPSRHRECVDLIIMKSLIALVLKTSYLGYFGYGIQSEQQKDWKRGDG